MLSNIISNSNILIAQPLLIGFIDFGPESIVSS